jgi:hypothetical protein
MMTDYEAARLAHDRIKSMATLLDSHYLHTEIDSRIDQVVDTLKFNLPVRPTVSCVHQALSVLVQAVYECGLRCPVRLSPAQALAEALDLLEQDYQAFGERGYFVALVEAITSEHMGLADVLTHVVQLIKNRERQKHIRWVVISCLGTLDWEAYLKVSSLVRERITDCFAQADGLWPPVMPAESLAKIILSENRTIQLLQAVLGRNHDFSPG